MTASLPALLGDRRVIAVVRHADAQAALEIGRAAVDGGLRCVEITCAVPDAASVIRELRATVRDDVLVGAGTVLEPAELGAVAAGGAQFVVSPGLDPEIVAQARAAGVPALPGVLTPSEVAQARALGLDAVKLFPAEPLGPAHLRALRSVFRDVAFVPTGGVTHANAAGWLAAGALAVGLAGEFGAAYEEGGAQAVVRLARNLQEALEPGAVRAR
jgi:2-dehydro-3-deoxyphosphogluconate aldolase/(4S)-4-hydroxy-2-oxoglutarate aldolase